MCVRFFQRADGTVLTADCPVGTSAAMRKARRQLRSFALSTLSFATVVLGALGFSGDWLRRTFGGCMTGALANTSAWETSAARNGAGAGASRSDRREHIGIVDFASNETFQSR